MKLLVPAALIVLYSCGTSTPPQPAPEKAAPRHEPAANEPQLVRLTPEQAATARVRIDAVQSRTHQETTRITGPLAVNENRTWRPGAVVEGRVVRTYANVGDPVTAGFVLARLHSHDIHESRNEYALALRERARTIAARDHAQRLAERAMRLYELKAGSLEQVQLAEAALTEAKAAVDRADIQIRRAETHLVDFLGVPAAEPDSHKPGQPHTDEDDLIPVRAPAGGIVVERKASAGSVVDAGQDLFVITDLSTVWMIAAVPENLVSRVRPGMSVNVHVNAYPDRSFPGRVARLGDMVDRETRTLPARIELANAGGLLKPEMFAEAEIPLDTTRDSIAIPSGAIQEVNGQSIVFVARETGAFEPVPVDAIPQPGGTVEIRSGLKPGDRVAVEGAFVLKSQLLRASLAEE